MNRNKLNCYRCLWWGSPIVSTLVLSQGLAIALDGSLWLAAASPQAAFTNSQFDHPNCQTSSANY